MNLQHIIIKVPVQGELAIEPGELIPVFHRWVAGQSMPEMLIDVADLRHVPDGPGVILVGSQADYSLDNANGVWGLQYRRKDVVDGSNVDRLTQALAAAHAACDRLEKELGGRIRFDRSRADVIVNDRALAPNTDETRAATAGDFDQFARAAFGASAKVTPQGGDPRRRFGVTISA